MSLERVIFSGSGGQGLMFVGKLFARVMVDRVDNVTFFPSYGSEVRGGTANCQVIMSSEEIASPIVEHPDSLVLMNQPSVDRFMPALTEDGIAFVNSSLADIPDDSRIIAMPASEMGLEAGDERSANIVMFGSFLRKKGLLPLEEAKEHVAAATLARMGKRAVEINLKALQAGWDF